MITARHKKSKTSISCRTFFCTINHKIHKNFLFNRESLYIKHRSVDWELYALISIT